MVNEELQPVMKGMASAHDAPAHRDRQPRRNNDPVVMRKEAIKFLEARLADIEREHYDELASEDTKSEARAEAKALAAVYDFLNDCKISHRQSLLRILERYLRRKSSTEVKEAEK